MPLELDSIRQQYLEDLVLTYDKDILMARVRRFGLDPSGIDDSKSLRLIAHELARSCESEGWMDLLVMCLLDERPQLLDRIGRKILSPHLAAGFELYDLCRKLFAADVNERLIGCYNGLNVVLNSTDLAFHKPASFAWCALSVMCAVAVRDESQSDGEQDRVPRDTIIWQFLCHVYGTADEESRRQLVAWWEAHSHELGVAQPAALRSAEELPDASVTSVMIRFTEAEGSTAETPRFLCKAYSISRRGGTTTTAEVQRSVLASRRRWFGRVL